jgi:hypothetical protein
MQLLLHPLVDECDLIDTANRRDLSENGPFLARRKKDYAGGSPGSRPISSSKALAR